MSTSRNRPLIFIIAVLLLTNIAVLGYFLWYKKPHKPSEGGGDRRPGIETPLQKEVGFTEDQMTKYRQMREEQMKAIKPMFEDMRKAKDSLFRTMGNENANDSVINAIADAIGQKQKEMDLRMYNHFKRIRSLCTPDQLVKYDSLVLRMMRKPGKPRKEQEKKDDK